MNIQTSNMISIIIPHRNLRPEWLKEAIQSVKDQTYTDWELIEAVGEDREKINKALKEAKGEYVVILSDDDKLPPDFLEKLIAYMPEYDIVSPVLESFGDVKEGQEGRHGPNLFPFYSSLFKRELVLRMGGFDSDMRQMGDVELWWRCIKIGGAKWTVVPSAFYYYRLHGDQDSQTCDWSEARKRVMEKYPDYSW